MLDHFLLFFSGVSVFLYERSPVRGKNMSPWAIKKSRKYTSSVPMATQQDDMIAKRMDKEAKILKSLKHPNIIGYRGYKRNSDGSRLLAVENGQRALLDLVEERNEDGEGEPFQAEKILFVIEETAKALKYLHQEKKLLHGDIKSANVLVIGDFEQVKLCDFGVSLRLDDDLVAEDGEFYIGTGPWQGMEVKEEDLITDKTDIFALGCTIFEM